MLTIVHTKCLCCLGPNCSRALSAAQGNARVPQLTCRRRLLARRLLLAAKASGAGGRVHNKQTHEASGAAEKREADSGYRGVCRLQGKMHAATCTRCSGRLMLGSLLGLQPSRACPVTEQAALWHVGVPHGQLGEALPQHVIQQFPCARLCVLVV
jgi:hypothetical protein